jgi:methylenetetrahydrofolate reductase (NADPH)
MPKITDMVRERRASAPNDPFFSFEYFPPKTEEGVYNLFSRMDRMCAAKPLWVDVTWGAGGSSSETTLALCENALECVGVDVLMHLTCTNTTVDELRKVLDRCKSKGLQNILALRGDPPANQKDWTATEGGFKTSTDLVRFIRKEYGDYFCIGVAAYPEGHTDCVTEEDRQMDLEYFKGKVDAGADFGVTQLFYDCSLYFDYLKKIRALGVPASFEVYPGLMPIQTYGGFCRMTSFCKTYIPEEIKKRLEPIQNDDAAVKAYGIELGIKMGKELLEGGAPSVHVYTLNLETTAMAIVDGLNLAPKNAVEQKAYPWSRGTGVRGTKETTRPIFWAQRPRSYVDRTSSWDDFPNGRFGSRESPAYGLFSKPPKPSEKVLAERREQLKFNGGIKGMQQVFVNFLTPNKNVKCLPWCQEQPGDETVSIRNRLIQLCEAGLVTINSQPRVNGALSSDPLFGWGPAGGVCYQKAYLEFFCDPDMLKKLEEGVKEFPYIELMAVNSKGDLRGNTTGAQTHYANTTAHVTAVTWGVFPGQEIQQPTVVDQNSFVAWKDEAFELWSDWYDALEESATESRALVKKAQSEWYLVNLVDNNYLSSDLFHTLVDLVNKPAYSPPARA